MRVKKSKSEPRYKQYLALQDEPIDHIGNHISNQDIDYWESRFFLKYRVLRNTRKLRKEFQE